jgi:bifunctional DNA-binding transcriptional regulator/antitoxin component of YhaV-PrlF toxin-antitoxin module
MDASQVDQAEPVEESDFEELLMLDRAGRLQIPPEVRERLAIGERVRLEVDDGRLVLHPVAGHRRSGEAAPLADDVCTDNTAEDMEEQTWIQRLRRWLERRRLR